MATVLELIRLVFYCGVGVVMLVFIAATIACACDRFFPEPPVPILPLGELQDDGTMHLRLELDAIDYRDIQRAITRRQLRRNWPRDAETLDGVSDLPGLAVAEICREWLRQNANVVG